IAWKEPILVDEWKFAQANSKAPVKAVLTGPLTLASLALDKHYRKKKPLALDAANALGEEVSGLVRAGATHIQIDEPILTRHPEDLPLAVEGLERIRARKGSAALTLFTYFGEVSKIFEELVETPANGSGRSSGSYRRPLGRWGSPHERSPDDERRFVPEARIPSASADEGVQGRVVGRRPSGPRGEGDRGVDPLPGGDRDRHPRGR